MGHVDRVTVVVVACNQEMKLLLRRIMSRIVKIIMQEYCNAVVNLSYIRMPTKIFQKPYLSFLLTIGTFLLHCVDYRLSFPHPLSRLIGSQIQAEPQNVRSN
eukprot:TRINITY_DN11740_c0_g4_i2.p1 TRINITY_DN11740_c0_g4~~TRINITY_DN11740_c0_g4_i2.p1  ORF type:complete len:102 (+),score=4.48 TRINITY_DN11740_c0_g4_i2:1402-1707(+)